MAMIEITTSNSIRVNAGEEECLFIGGLRDSRKTAGQVKKEFAKTFARSVQRRRRILFKERRFTNRRPNKTAVCKPPLLVLLAALLRFELKGDSRQRRQTDHERMRPALPWEILSLKATHIANITTTIGFRVGVDDFAVKTRAGNAEPIPLP